jgi:hypothetical protein
MIPSVSSQNSNCSADGEGHGWRGHIVLELLVERGGGVANLKLHKKIEVEGHPSAIDNGI